MTDDNEPKAFQDPRGRGERDVPIEVQLGDVGPYRLPRGDRVVSAYIADAHTVEFELLTARGQRVFVPIAASELAGLRALLGPLLSRLSQ